MKFLNYIKLLFKNAILLLCFVLDLIGLIITYTGELNIPKYVLILILFVGILYSSFKIYESNMPEINSTITPIKDNWYRSKCIGENFSEFQLTYNMYLNNYGAAVGVIEDINVSLKKYGSDSDSFLKTLVDFSFTECVVSDEEIPPALDFLSSSKKVKYPIMIEPKKTLNKYLMLVMNVKGNERVDYLGTIDWLLSDELLPL